MSMHQPIIHCISPAHRSSMPFISSTARSTVRPGPSQSVKASKIDNPSKVLLSIVRYSIPHPLTRKPPPVYLTRLSDLPVLRILRASHDAGALARGKGSLHGGDRP